MSMNEQLPATPAMVCTQQVNADNSTPRMSAMGQSSKQESGSDDQETLQRLRGGCCVCTGLEAIGACNKDTLHADQFD